MPMTRPEATPTVMEENRLLSEDTGHKFLSVKILISSKTLNFATGHDASIYFQADPRLVIVDFPHAPLESIV